MNQKSWCHIFCLGPNPSVIGALSLQLCDEREHIFHLHCYTFSFLEVKLYWILNIIWIGNTTVMKDAHFTSVLKDISANLVHVKHQNVTVNSTVYYHLLLLFLFCLLLKIF